MTKITPNNYKVSTKEWNKWTPNARELFNNIYGAIWLAAWDSAWMAASDLSKREKGK